MTERASGRFDSREAIIGMSGKTSARFPVEIQFGFGNNTQGFEHGILRQRTVTLGNNESIIGILAEFPAHESVVNRIHDFQAGESRRDVQRADRLRNIKNAAAMRRHRARAATGSNPAGWQ